jgi:trehalose synthase-fused probable maltokinase
MEEIALRGRPPIHVASWVWGQFIGGPFQEAFEAALGRAIVTWRWFGAKTRTISAVEIVNAIPLGPAVRLILIQIEFTQGPADVYQIPLAFALGPKAERLLAENSPSLWVRVQLGDRHEPAVLFDGLYDATVCQDLLRLIETESRWPGMMTGELVGWQATSFDQLRGDIPTPLASELVHAEQSNSSVIYGDRLILKLFRRVEMGLNPDLEMNAHLTEHGFDHVPPLGGAIEYRQRGQEPWAAAMLQGFVPNQGDAWRYTLDRLDGFFESLVGQSDSAGNGLQLPADGIVRAAERAIPAPVSQTLAAFLSDAERLGTRTGQLHLTLAADTENPTFRPELFTSSDQNAFYERCQQLAGEVFELLRRQLPNLADRIRPHAIEVLRLEAAVHEQLRRVVAKPIYVWQIRCHGDYHLGQVLVKEHDFVIIDFEGEPARPLSERRKKQLALRDVAGMIRSYHYAGCSAAARAKQSRPQTDARSIEQWAQAWHFWTSVAFLTAYRQIAARAVFLPASGEEFECLLETCLLEKALYELRYELNNRPDWVYLPLQALTDLVGGNSTTR